MRRPSTPVTASILTVAMLGVAAPVAALGWSDPVTLSALAPSKSVYVRDIAARGASVAVAWEERPVSGNRAVYLRWSTATGGAWQPRVRLSTRIQLEPRIDICGGSVWATSRIEASDAWLIELDRRGLSSSSASSAPVSGVGEVRGPDIACAGPRLAIAWFEKVDGVWKVRLRARAVTGGLATYSATLGKGSPSRGLAVAGTPDRIYVGWYQGKTFRLRRFAIGGGPQAAVSSLGTRSVGLAADGGVPRLGAAGARVGLAFMSGGNTYASVSRDRGGSFGVRRRLLSAAFEITSVPGQVDVRGSTVIVAASDSYVGYGYGHVFRSVNDGASWSKVPGATRPGGAMVAAFASPGGATRIVEAWDTSYSFPEQERVRFRRQQ